MEEWVAGTAFEWHCGWEALAMPGRMVRACIPTLTLRDYQWTAGRAGSYLCSGHGETNVFVDEAFNEFIEVGV